MDAAEFFGAVQGFESLLLFGGAAFLIYWFATSDATQSIRDALSKLAPQAGSISTPPRTPGGPTVAGATSPAQYGIATQGQHYSVQPSGAISVLIGSSPSTYGPNATIDNGSRATISDYRMMGYTDAEIVDMIVQAETHPEMAGASFSF
jgi:hypothetical protein